MQSRIDIPSLPSMIAMMLLACQLKGSTQMGRYLSPSDACASNEVKMLAWPWHIGKAELDLQLFHKSLYDEER